MRRFCCVVLMLVWSGCVETKSARPFCDNFSAPLDRWDVVSGEWVTQGGKLKMMSTEYERYIALAAVDLVNGAVSGTAKPTAKSSLGWGAFGVVVKYTDSANWIAVRFGAYDGITVMKQVAGQLSLAGLGKFTAEIGREYRFEAIVSGGRVEVRLDGKTIGRAEVPFAGVAGRPGLYTEASGEYDDFEVAGAIAIATSKPVLPGAPRLELEHASWRPDFPMKEEAVSLHGTMFLYFRNRGTGPAMLSRLRMDGKDADDLARSGDMAWYRQQPDLVGPGEIGEIEVRLPSLPEQAGLALFRDDSARPKAQFRIEPVGGEPLDVAAEFTSAQEPLQINVIHFAPGLKKLYVYVQNNRALLGGDKSPFHVESLSVDGADATSSARFGSREIGADVVPIEVPLEKPVPEGKPVVVLLRTAEGVRAGHCLRAFAFDFPIQVTLLGKQVRPDAVEDIFRHGADCIGACGAGDEWLAEAKRLGMRAFPYGGRLSYMIRLDKPDSPRPCAFWLDELDRFPPRQAARMVEESREHYRREGRFAPAQMLNIIGALTAGGCDYVALGDACCHEYGWDGNSLTSGFGDPASLPFREYRRARRPFFPYFRNAELPLIYDPTTKSITGRELKRGARAIEPREERWMTYGCLIQGATGICHWNYGTALSKPPNWFSTEHWIVRAAMGGPLLGGPDGIRIPSDAQAELKAVWGEIGEINVELRTIGPIVAVSDVSSLASVQGAKPVNAAALLCGLDSIVVIALNQGLKTTGSLAKPKGIESYDPVDVDIALRLPPWLEPKDCFLVRHSGIAPIAPVREPGRMTFRLQPLAVNEVIVITSDPALRGTMEKTRREMKARLRDVKP